ncbi:MAG: ATP-dependent Clp protease ATP-binding subunit [Planctomycetia bacterium]|nr:ATP-dependent Clp protease ATP-binding subunit [Planctomycetia bacterium]
MLFQNDTLDPEALADPRIRAVLGTAASPAHGPLRPVDLVQSAIGQADQPVLALLSQALAPGASLQEVLQSVLAISVATVTSRSGRRRRAEFSPESLQALEEFEAILVDRPRLGAEAGLELLLCCLLTHVEEADQRVLPWLDLPRAADLLRHQVLQINYGKQTDHPNPAERPVPPRTRAPATESAPPLPPELANWEDLTHRARTATHSGAFPFDDEPRFEQLFAAIARVLHRRTANHVLLTGERGVGKSTILTELARRAATGRIPFLRQRRFVSVDCRYVPADESRQRLTAILTQAAARPELVVCLDGFASLLRAERGDPRAALFSVLSRARCQVIGLLTPREFEELAADDPDFAEFFTRVDVEEPDTELALKILRHFAHGLQHKYRLSIDDEAVRQAVVLSANYILNDHLPAKALKLLHRVCEDFDFERSQQGQARVRVTVDDVVRAVAERSGVPAETLRGVAERSDYGQSLREYIFGQDHAVAEVATELGLIKAGMTDPHKPASVMLFLGQTGTGKTELAKALARFYSTSKRLKTYTLGNCVEPHSVATIIGVPPGYVGHDSGGRLVKELNADPYCVFLLDEADKAHPDVLQPFLNLFDEGWVNDQRGARGYANKSIFILTSNVGQRMIADLMQQGKTPEEIAERMKEVLSQIRHTKSDRPVFTPEFLARIKRIIVFRPLDQGAMAGICRKQVAELVQGWAEKRGKRLEIPAALVTYLADAAHRLNEKSQGKEGGRIVRKLLSEHVEARLQREISQRPADYQHAAGLALDFVPPTDEGLQSAGGTLDIQVRFCP